ncbi:MAG: redoxin family protein [Planctomycetia bacterium]|nr:redoxin family protein [Planctomycetia bacterium]
MSMTSRLRISGKKLFFGCLAAAAPLLPASIAHANPTVEQALALAPLQKDVEFDKPTGDETAKCTIKVEKNLGTSGWIVYDPTGQIIRRFTDTNGDNTVDQWSYFAGGLEVYRDVDSNANGKADQFRWLNTGGSRWALDTNEDGTIDSWKSISAEEVSAEAVAAMGQHLDGALRFQRLLLTPEELQTLGLGETQLKEIGAKLAAAPKRFTGLSNDDNKALIATGSRWLNFSGSKPSTIPAGTNGSTKDILVYENIVAMFEAGGKSGQLQIGTMIKVGEGWRLIDMPERLGEGDAQLAAGYFTNQVRAVPGNVKGTTTEGAGDFPVALEENEKKTSQASDAKQLAALKKERADLIEKNLAGLDKAEDREIWIRQLIDTCSDGAQTGSYPEGLARLQELEKKLAVGNDKEHVPYARFSIITSVYMSAMNAKDANFNKTQGEWLDNLRQFVKDFPKSKEAAEAISHLAIDSEFAGKEDDAKKLYTQIVQEFPKEQTAGKAMGALRRLDSIGKPMVLAGKTADGKAFDLKVLAGKTVVVHYWTSAGATTAGDVAQLKQIQAKYARDNVVIVGVSLDVKQPDLLTYLETNRLPWIQLFEDGGMESRFAQEMGIFTVPTIMLVDATGKVVGRNVELGLLDKELAERLRK